MKTLTLINKSKSIQTINLPHHIVPERATRGVVGTLAHDPASGERHVRAHKKAISGSITLMAAGTDGSTVEGLPLSVASAPDTKRMIAAQIITYKIVDSEHAASEHAKKKHDSDDDKTKTPAATPAKKGA